MSIAWSWFTSKYDQLVIYVFLFSVVVVVVVVVVSRMQGSFV